MFSDNKKRSKSNKVRFRNNKYDSISKDAVSWLSDKDMDHIFFDTGLKITTLQYNVVRILCLIAFLVFIIAAYFNGQDVVKLLVYFAIIFFVSSPYLDLLGKKTPFGYVIDTLRNEFRAKKDVEIYRAMSQLKNLAIAQQESPLGADFIIEQLLKFTNVTRSTFTQMLSIWRLGREDEAKEFFDNAIGTKLGKEFSNILIKLDKINPVELVDQLVLYQSHVKEEKITEKLRKQEAISDIIFIPIIASAFAILLNFVIIVVWLDSLGAINNLN